MEQPVADLDQSLVDLKRNIEQRAYVDNNLSTEDALFLLGSAMAVATGMQSERDRLRQALAMIAIPPHDDPEFIGCAGCAYVAQAALDGRDFTATVAQLGQEAEGQRARLLQVVTAAQEFAAAQAEWLDRVQRGERVLVSDDLTHRRAATTATLCHEVRMLDLKEPDDE